MCREPGHENCSFAERQVGNVTEDSELTFEYGIKAKYKQKSEEKLEPTQVSVPVADPAPGTDIPESIAVEDESKPKELGAEGVKNIYIFNGVKKIFKIENFFKIS